MGYFQRATQYGAKGGDQALARRAKQFAEMQNLARFNQVLPEDQEAPGAEGFKGAFFRVVDLISRPNYAITGIVDTMNGTGKEGEYAMERAFREMFSGVAGLKGDKEVFGDVLKQGGMGEFGKLSDMIGDNGLTRNFNPTTRDAVGLALDIFTDPLTYISAPIKNASVVVGLGGEVRFLNKAGLAARAAKVEAKMVEWRKVLNLPKEAGELSVMRAIGESAEFAARNSDVTTALAKAEATGITEVTSTLFREAGEELVAKGGGNLFEKTGLRYRPLPGVDLPVGVDKLLAKGTGKVGGFLWRGMQKTDFGKQAIDFTSKKLQALDSIFNQVPFLARKNTKYYRDRSEWFVRRTASGHIAALEADTLMKGVPRKVWEDRNLWRGFARAIEQSLDNPTAVEEWVTAAKQAGIEDPQRFMEGWTKTFDRVGRSEVDIGQLASQDFLAHEGRYFHRVVDQFDTKTRNELTQLSARRSGRAGLPERSFRQQRLFDTWDEFEANALSKGIKEEELVLNPFEVAKARLSAHYEDMVTQQFLERTYETMGFKTSTEFTKLNQGLRKLAEEKSGDSLDTALRALPADATEAQTMKVIHDAIGFDEAQSKFLIGLRERSSTFNPDGYRAARRMELSRLLTDTPEGEAFKRIEEIVAKLGDNLTERQSRIRVARLQEDYKKVVQGRSRAEIFDQNQFRTQAKSEAVVWRGVKKDLVAAQKFLRSEGSRLAKESGVGGELSARVAAENLKLRDLQKLKRSLAEKAGVPEARLELKAVEERIRRQKKLMRGLGGDERKVVKLQAKEARLGSPERAATAGSARQSIVDAIYAQYDKMGDAVLRADDLGDLVKKRKGLAAGMRDEAEDLILDQVKSVKAWKGALNDFMDKFKRDIVQDLDGNTVRSLQDELNLLAKEMDDITARRSLITERKALAREEIRKADDVFQDLESSLASLTDDAAYTRTELKRAKGAAKVAKQEFAEAFPTTVKQVSAADIAKFRKLPREARAAYLHDALAEIDDIKHFESFVIKWGDEMDAVSPEMGTLADAIATGKIYDQYGQEFTRISIQAGPRAKNTLEIDKAINQYDAEAGALKVNLEKARERKAVADTNMKVHKNGPDALNDEVAEILKLEQKIADRRLAEVKLDKKAAKLSRDAALAERKAVPKAARNKQFYVPEGIAKDLQNIENTFLQNPEVYELLNVYDKFSNWFKLAVTRYFPAFHVRNAYSNVAASFVDIGMEALNPQRARQALDIMRGADGTFMIGKQSVPYEMIRQELDVLGIKADRSMISELTGPKGAVIDPLETIIKKTAQREGALEKVAGVAEKAYVIPGNIENHARAMHYISLRRKGFAIQDAATQVNKFLFDYADLSPTERSVFRRLFPFMTWTRKNLERQVRNLYEAPGRVATQIKLSTGDRGPSGDMLPEYLRGQMSVKVQSDENGETWLTGIDLPVANLDLLWAGGLGKTFREQIGLLSPIIKSPLEAGVGQDFFTGRSLRGVGQIREKLGFSMNRNLPKVLREYFELENIGSEEKPRWQANRLKLHIATKAMFVSRFVSSKVQFDDMLRQFGAGDDARGASMILKMLSGMDLRGFDLESKERATIYNRARQLEDLLISRGLMRQFNKAFIPKERKAEMQADQTAPAGTGFFSQATRGR